MMVVDTVCVPNSFHTIEAGRNNRSYYNEFGRTNVGEITQAYTVKIIPGGITILIPLQKRFNWQ